jgi:hypothetical protein
VWGAWEAGTWERGGVRSEDDEWTVDRFVSYLWDGERRQQLLHLGSLVVGEVGSVDLEVALLPSAVGGQLEQVAGHVLLGHVYELHHG